MAEKKPVLIRMDPDTHEALQRWAGDEFRSLNAQIEFLLRRALDRERRLAGAKDSGERGRSPEGSA